MFLNLHRVIKFSVIQFIISLSVYLVEDIQAQAFHDSFPSTAESTLAGRTPHLLRDTRGHIQISHLPSENNRKVVQNLAEIPRKRRARNRQIPSPTTTQPSPGACECMDYWECVTNDGQVYSYCGISDSEVCCFHKSKIVKSNLQNTNLPSSSTIVKDAIVNTPRATESGTSSGVDRLFSTGNKNTTLNDFTATTRPVTATPFLITLAPTLPFTTDVDYFYSVEDGDGDLRRITVTESLQPQSSTEFYNNADVSYCGKQSVNWRLDSKAEFREWPWHVALLEIRQDLYICGGALIAHDRVLTAAHCVHPYARVGSTKLKVRAGEYDVSTHAEADPYFEVLVDKIIIHPHFDNATLTNDVALLKLRSSLNYSANIRPVCLPKSGTISAVDIPGQGDTTRQPQCVVTGWGRLTETSPFSIVMKEIVVPLWTHSECEAKLQRTFGNSYRLPSTAICAGKRDHDACDGDGGGGLVCLSSEQQWTLVGIVSFGVGCGRIDSPGVYTSVLKYINWISSFNFL